MCYSKGYQQTKENPSIIGHRQAWDAIVYWCFLLFSPLLVASFHLLFISSPLTTEFLLLLIVFHCDFSNVFHPSASVSLCLFAEASRWRELEAGLWSPLTHMTGHSGLQRPMPSKQGDENDLLCIFGKGFPTHTRPLTVYPKPIEVDSFHLHKLPKCGHDYWRKWWWPVVPSPSSFPWPFLLLYHLASHFLLLVDRTCS